MESDVAAAIVALAQEADVLLVGEIHGTQEVPQLVSDWLAWLRPLGYRTLGLEIPSLQQAPLRQWALGQAPAPPPFFTHPLGDGRGNMQVLQLVQAAIASQWQLICFDAP